MLRGTIKQKRRIMNSRRDIACMLVVLAVSIPFMATQYPINRLTFEPSHEGQPAWSPDEILIVGRREGGFVGVFLNSVFVEKGNE